MPATPAPKPPPTPHQRARASRWFRRCLRLFPIEFRGDFGDEMSQAFDEQNRHTPRGIVARLRLWRDTLVDLVRAAPREHWQMFRQDVGYAVRTMSHRPAFVATTVLSLALAIGGNTAVFAVIDAVLLRPLPYPAPDELVAVWSRHLDRGLYGTSLQDYEDFRAQSRSFSEMGVYVVQTATLTGLDEPERASFALVSPSLMRTLAVEPSLGRWFLDDENLPGANEVVLISHGFWRRAFGGDTGIVGRPLAVEGRPHTILGVMPADFAFPSSAVTFWKPFGLRPDDAGSRGGRWVRTLARVAPGVGLEAARSEMAGIAAALAEAYPDTNRDFTSQIERLHDSVVGSTSSALLLLWGAIGLVLLVACANVANLLLARGAVRERDELAIRTALGASRARLVRQLLTENVLLALLGAAGGLALAAWAISLLPVLASGSLPRVEHLAIDARVAGYAVLVTMATGVLFGIVPMFRGASAAPAGALQAASLRGSTSRDRLRGVLVVVEVAVAVVVLVGAGLLVRSFQRVLAHDVGFEPVGLVTARIEPGWAFRAQGLSEDEFVAAFAQDRARGWAFYQELFARLEQLPGVARVSAVNAGPLTGNRWSTTLAIEGQTYLSPSDRPDALYRVVAPGYFSTMQIPMLEGRGITEEDRAGGLQTAVVSDSFARAYLEGDALGRRLSLGRDQWFTIVGVSGDLPTVALEADRRPMVHIGFPQAEWGFGGNWGLDILIRTEGSPDSLAAGIRSTIHAFAPNLPVVTLSPMSVVIDETLARRRFNTLLLSLFAGTAFVLSVIGLHGVLSFSVSQRLREMGIRSSLGATRPQLVALVIGQGARLTGAGVAIGLLGAVALSRYVEGQLHEVSATDPMTLVAVVAIVFAAALGACWWPARRAAAVDPVRALRG